MRQSKFKTMMQNLLQIGKEKGHITYDELNDKLGESASSEQIEDMMEQLSKWGINVVERWEDYQEAKEWYARIKSRPSFRPLLGDYVPGTRPPAHYSDLDF